MRILMRVSIPVEAGNRGVKDNTLSNTIKQFAEKHRPEAAYFYTMEGQRTCSFVVDVKDPTEIPTLCEPFFQQLNAGVTFCPVMNLQDLSKGIEISKK